MKRTTTTTNYEKEEEELKKKRKIGRTIRRLIGKRERSMRTRKRQFKKKNETRYYFSHLGAFCLALSVFVHTHTNKEMELQ